jgi:hypothetical protein
MISAIKRSINLSVKESTGTGEGAVARWLVNSWPHIQECQASIQLKQARENKCEASALCFKIQMSAYPQPMRYR